jgi:hypothetical protein
VTDTSAIASVLWLGTDSLAACLGIGLLTTTWLQRVRLAVAFGGCDAFASIRGPGFLHDLPAPPAIALYLSCAMLLGLAARWDRRVLYLIPLLLSIDNALSGTPASLAPLLGLSSAVLAMAGLALTGVCRQLFADASARILIRGKHECRGYNTVL